MVDNSISPCELISGWFSPRSTVEIDGVLHPWTSVHVPAFIYMMPPTALSRGVSSLHSCSTCEVWHRWQGITEHFLRSPSSVGSPRCHSWRTLSVTLHHQLATSLWRLHECHL